MPRPQSLFYFFTVTVITTFFFPDCTVIFAFPAFFAFILPLVQKLDKIIYEKIPSGFEIREKTHPYFDEIDLTQLYCYKHINPARVEKSLGTLGGGNHFIEADKDEDGNLYLVVHSGSRHLGLEVAQYYQEEGWKALNGTAKKDIELLIADLKAQGREQEIQAAIEARKSTVKTDVPRMLACLREYMY